jgi:hypothetical protein
MSDHITAYQVSQHAAYKRIRGEVFSEVTRETLIAVAKASTPIWVGLFGYSVLSENLDKCAIGGGLAVCPNLTAAVAVAVEMWKPASFAGFQAPRAGRTVVAEAPSSRPRSVISTARPRFIGHSVENVLFGRPTERK